MPRTSVVDANGPWLSTRTGVDHPGGDAATALAGGKVPTAAAQRIAAAAGANRRMSYVRTAFCLACFVFACLCPCVFLVFCDPQAGVPKWMSRFSTARE